MDDLVKIWLRHMAGAGANAAVVSRSSLLAAEAAKGET